MIFQTYTFVIFFTIVCILAYILKGKANRIMLLFASLFFYAYDSILHLPVLLFVILWTFLGGFCLEKCKKKKVILALFISIALAPLLFYKYIPFFAAQFIPQLSNNSFFRYSALPVGISFFTFQSIGYLVDVYHEKQDAAHDFVTYGLFIAFFPQVMSGPIGRSTDLIAQLKKERIFDYNNVATGLRMMGYGLFLKILAADSLGYIVDSAYDNFRMSSATILVVATFFFGIQIYCDFKGYTMMACGAARILGIYLINNFNRPYFSRSITEFWRRWHISLTSWFRDYVYIPLGGNRKGNIITSLNLLITFLLSGLWHGANWTFIIWGGLNGIYLIIEKQLKLSSKTKSGFSAGFGWVYTYLLINISWLFFRADSLSDAVFILKKFSQAPSEIINLMKGIIGISSIMKVNSSYFWEMSMGVVSIIIIILIGLYESKRGEISERMANFPLAVRWIIYLLCLFITLAFGTWGTTNPFIYFRF